MIKNEKIDELYEEFLKNYNLFYFFVEFTQKLAEKVDEKTYNKIIETVRETGHNIRQGNYGKWSYTNIPENYLK